MGIRVLVAKFLRVMPCTLILHEPFCSWSLLACCIFYTFQNLDPPNLELGACCVYYTHAQHWFSKFWSLGHVLYLHMPNRDPPTLGACSMLFILTHAQPYSCNFQSLGACWIFYTCPALILLILEIGHVVHLHMPNSDIQISELAAWCIFDTCQPWSSKILELEVGFICNTCPTSILHIWRIEVGHCIFYTCKTLVLQLWEFGGMFFVLHMPSLDPVMHLHMPKQNPPNFGA